jgi:hypothetical protein
MRAIAAVGIAFCVAATQVGAQVRQTEDSFRWAGRVASGGTLKIQNLAGRITVQPSGNGQIQVTGRKEWRRGDPEDVRFEVIPGTNVVTICAVWFDGGCGDRRGNDSGNDDRDRNNDVSVAFTVALPPGVNLDASGVSAAIDVTGVSGDIAAASVSGDVDLSDISGDVRSSSVSGNVTVRGGTLGTITANSVSGNVSVSVDALSGSGDLVFSTVSGDVEATLPSGLGADVQMSTVSGELTSDFPLTIPGGRRDDRRAIRGRIGAGGRTLRFTTVSGDVVLRQR